jgi:hypothetical protein
VEPYSLLIVGLCVRSSFSAGGKQLIILDVASDGTTRRLSHLPYFLFLGLSCTLSWIRALTHVLLPVNTGWRSWIID